MPLFADGLLSSCSSSVAEPGNAFVDVSVFGADDAVESAAHAANYDSDSDDDGDDGGPRAPMYSAGDATNITVGPHGFIVDNYTMDGMVEPVHTVQAVHIGYTKRAKQVDVRRLKKSLWSKLQADLGEGEQPHSPADEAPAAAPDTLSFKSTVQQLAPEMPDNVTLPFYFLCVLHLANEHGLRLEGSQSLDDFAIAADA